MLKVRSAIQLSVLVLLSASATLALSSFENASRTIVVLVALLALLLALRLRRYRQGCLGYNMVEDLVVVGVREWACLSDRGPHTVETDPLDAWAIFRIGFVRNGDSSSRPTFSPTNSLAATSVSWIDRDPWSLLCYLFGFMPLVGLSRMDDLQISGIPGRRCNAGRSRRDRCFRPNLQSAV